VSVTRWWTALVAGMCLAAVVPHTAAAQPVGEYPIKAAFLYSFTLFVEWPAEATSGGSFIIGVVGDDAFADVLAETVRTKTVHGSRVEVRRLTVVDDLRSCRLVFVSAGADRRNTVPRRARGAPILTVGETADFLQDGGVIRFLIENAQLRFQLNVNAATDARLTISSRLRAIAAPNDTP
jgi:hypothetical protein